MSTGTRNSQRKPHAVGLTALVLMFILVEGSVRPASAQTITYSSNASLSGDLFCSTLTINSGVTLTTNGFNIYCSGAVTNNGLIQTGLVGNGGMGANESPAGATSGGPLPSSYGGSGGGGGGSAAVSLGPAQISGTGGNTLAPGGGGGTELGGSCGTGGPGSAGSTPGSPSITNSLIQTWYGNGLSKFLAGGGGGGGAGSGFVCSDTGGSAGGSGAYGIYIQANQIVTGTIATSGQSGGTGGSAGGGGGGGGTVVLAYGSGGYVAGSYFTSGGAGGLPGPNGGAGGNGGSGQVLTFNYGINPPIPVSSPNFVNLSAACVNGLLVDINGGAGSSSGASVTSISWTWGDGTTTTGFFPQSHTYSTQGQYTVQVTAHYNNGSTASSSQVVNVASGFLSNCLALTILAGPFGSVAYQASVGSGTVPAASSVTLQLDFADDLSLTGNPNAGFSFSNWFASGGIAGINGAPINSTSPSINIVVSSAAAIGAIFSVNGFPAQQIPTTVTLSANPSSVAESTNTPATITATVLDQTGSPIAGTSITFASTAGTLLFASATTDPNGQAVVTLVPNNSPSASAVITATAGSAQGMVSVRFVQPASPPTNWLTSAALSTTQLTLPLSQYLSIPLGEYNGCIQLHICSGSPINFNQLPPANLYLLFPVSSSASDESQFVAALSTYFGFSIGPCASSSQAGCVQSTYNPRAVLILELPIAQASDVLFNSVLQLPLPPLCFPQSVAKVLSSSCAQTTPTGNLNLAFIISQNSNTAQFVSNVLQAFVSNLSAVAKPSLSAALGSFAADLQALLSVGDLTVSVIRSDLSQPGLLATATLLDLDELQTVTNSVLAAGTDLDKAWTIGQSAGIFIVSRDPVSALQALVTSLDLGVEILPQFIQSLQTNTLYLSFNNYLGLVTTALDPPNAKVFPSYYDSNGSLILGYNPANGTMIYANQNAILFLAGNGYFALLPEDPSNPSTYSETLNATGPGVPLPYSLHIRSYNRDETAQVYSGILVGGTSVTIPIQFNSANGALIPQSYLNPSVTEAPIGNSITLVAKAVLSNGSTTTATSAFLILDGQQYTMTQQDPSTFAITIPNSFLIPTTAMIYMISPNTPGGFASVVLGQPAGVHMVTALQSLTLNTSTHQYVAVLTVTNTAGTTAANVTIAGSQLNSTSTSTVLPVKFGNLGYGGSATVTLTYPISAGAIGSLAVLKVTETYNGGNAGGAFRVTLP